MLVKVKEKNREKEGILVSTLQVLDDCRFVDTLFNDKSLEKRLGWIMDAVERYNVPDDSYLAIKHFPNDIIFAFSPRHLTLWQRIYLFFWRLKKR